MTQSGFFIDPHNTYNVAGSTRRLAMFEILLTFYSCLSAEDTTADKDPFLSQYIPHLNAPRIPRNMDPRRARDPRLARQRGGAPQPPQQYPPQQQYPQQPPGYSPPQQQYQHYPPPHYQTPPPHYPAQQQQQPYPHQYQQPPPSFPPNAQQGPPYQAQQQQPPTASPFPPQPQSSIPTYPTATPQQYPAHAISNQQLANEAPGATELAQHEPQPVKTIYKPRPLFCVVCASNQVRGPSVCTCDAAKLIPSLLDRTARWKDTTYWRELLLRVHRSRACQFWFSLGMQKGRVPCRLIRDGLGRPPARPCDRQAKHIPVWYALQ